VAPAPVDLSALTTLAEGVGSPEGSARRRTERSTSGARARSTASARRRPRRFSRPGASCSGWRGRRGRVYVIDNVRKCVWRVDPEQRTMEVWAEGRRAPFGRRTGARSTTPAYYLTDSGGWGRDDGLIWRIRRGGAPEVSDREVRAFPNGLCLSRRLEPLHPRELPGGAVEVPILPTGPPARAAPLRPRPRRPDGWRRWKDGGFLIACYRPDAVLAGIRTRASTLRRTCADGARGADQHRVRRRDLEVASSRTSGGGT
jgi:hypothetical protein